MLHIFAMVFKCFSGVFYKCFRHMFQMFHLSSLYVATVASGCFKSRSDVAHGIRVRSGWRHARRSGRGGTTADALAREPNTWYHRVDDYFRVFLDVYRHRYIDIE